MLESKINTYSHKNTILAFNLETWQRNVLGKVIQGKEIKGNKLKIFCTDTITDLYAIPHFIAFINFEGVEDKEQKAYFEYWIECIKPVLGNLSTQTSGEAVDNKEYDTKMPLSYVINSNLDDFDKISCLNINKDIFADSERLRLAILQETKNIEGKGQANNKASDKVIRILFMYKHLVYKGWLSKEVVDQWAERKGEKNISVRTFMRDVEIIRIMDRYVYYNKDTKRYELNLFRSRE